MDGDRSFPRSQSIISVGGQKWGQELALMNWLVIFDGNNWKIYWFEATKKHMDDMKALGAFLESLKGGREECFSIVPEVTSEAEGHGARVRGYTVIVKKAAPQ